MHKKYRRVFLTKKKMCYVCQVYWNFSSFFYINEHTKNTCSPRASFEAKKISNRWCLRIQLCWEAVAYCILLNLVLTHSVVHIHTAYSIFGWYYVAWYTYIIFCMWKAELRHRTSCTLHLGWMRNTSWIRSIDSSATLT